MSVRAKFTVTEITQVQYLPEARKIVLTPMYDTSIPEDARFCAATPSGRLEMFVTNPVAIEQMPLGTAFYVDFTPVA